MAHQSVRILVADLLCSTGARAAGFWWRVEEHLVLECFEAAPDMETQVATDFTNATRRIPLDRLDLGVVKALVEGGPVSSIAGELPAEVGSGLWLRAFGAACSVAVPLNEGAGSPRAVLSVALPEIPDDFDAMIARISNAGTLLLRDHRQCPSPALDVREERLDNNA